jgi:hypothetical protein
VRRVSPGVGLIVAVGRGCAARIHNLLPRIVLTERAAGVYRPELAPASPRQYKAPGGKTMRMMMQFECPLEPFNTLVRNGTAGQKIKQILDETKPEAAYFGEREGKRGGIFIVDVANPSDVPRLAEPLFLAFNAEVTFRVCMLPQDLAQANLEALGKKWG